MQHEVVKLLVADLLAIDRDRILVLDLLLGRPADLAIDRNLPGLDQFLDLGAGSLVHVRQVFVQAQH